jgi:hypothetical protein
MECFQLHLEVNQRLQEVASFKRNKYFPEEIDIALNKAQYRLLEKSVEQDFQSNQLNLSTVSGLIQTNKMLDLIIPSDADNLNELNILNQYSTIPPDLYWTINTRVETLTDPRNCEEAPNLGTNTISEYVVAIGYPTPTSPSPFYGNLQITSSVQGTLYTAPAGLAYGVQTSQGRYIITQNILEYFYKHPTVKAYWERYRNTYQQGKFIFVSNSPFGSITINTTTGTTSALQTQTNYSIFNRGAINSLTSKKVQISTARLVQQANLYLSLFNNTFYNTSVDNSIVTQNLDYFTVYRDKSFIVTKLMVDYIRKPRTISLSLDQTCELADNTHPKLIDLAVELLRLDTKDNSYPASVQDTELRN